MDTRYFQHNFIDTGPFVSDTQSRHTEKADAAGKKILQGLMADYTGPVAVRLWNRETVIGKPGALCTLVFNHPRVLRDLILHRDLIRLAEHHLSGTIDVEGDMELLFSLTGFLQTTRWSFKQHMAALWNALQLPFRLYHDGSGISTGKPHS